MARISITKEAVDPFFNNVSLLLPFDGSFDDASNNNFTVTPNGNVQISSAQSKFGGGSAYFDGSGDYLRASIPRNYDNNFTIEGWVYRTGSNFLNTIFEAGDISVSQFGIHFGTDSSGTFYWNDAQSGDISAGSAPLNQWVHFAMVRNNGTNTLYINGVSVGTSNQSFPASNNIITIGGTPNYGFYFPGYIDDFRITFGVARYTANFTPPGPLFNIGKINIQRRGIDPFFNNVSLLLPMDTSFADFSSNNFALTVNGGAEIRTDQTKFGGGAGYFGPSNHYLTASSSSLFGFGTGDFTIEMWIYPQGTSSFQGFFNANDYTNGILMRWHANSTFDSLYVNGTAYDWDPEIHAPVNTWSHVALVRYGGTVKMFVNGVNRIGSVTNNSDIGASAVPFIGASAHSPGEGFNGYIDDIRITKGVARYTADFTPPNSSFSAGKSGKINISKLPFPMANLLAFWRLEGLTDSSGNGYTLTNNGSVQFSAGKIGNCAVTDGSNYLSVSNFTINGPFSLSFWMKVTAGYGNANIGVNQYPGMIVAPTSPFDGSVVFSDFASWGVYSAPGVIQSDAWHHYCLVTSETSTALYIDGVNVASSNVHLCSMANPQRVFGIFGNEVDGTYGGNSKGSMDALGLWSRALTINEVKTLYNNGVGLEP